MSIAYDTLHCLVSITQFNKGQASRIFDRLNTEKQLIVLKNNKPSAVILSPEEFIHLSEIAENYDLLTEAQNRLQTTSGKILSFDEVMQKCDITKEDFINAEEIEIS